MKRASCTLVALLKYSWIGKKEKIIGRTNLYAPRVSEVKGLLLKKNGGWFWQPQIKKISDHMTILEPLYCSNVAIFLPIFT